MDILTNQLRRVAQRRRDNMKHNGLGQAFFSATREIEEVAADRIEELEEQSKEDADTIIKLTKRYCELEAAQRWIPVSTPPEIDDFYNVVEDTGFHRRVFMAEFCKGKWINPLTGSRLNAVEWQDLPPLPPTPQEQG